MSTPSDLARTWNENRGTQAGVKADRLSSDRVRHARARLRETPDLDRWASAVRRLTSGFGKGKNWCGFDFLIRPGSLDRIEEGKYDLTAVARIPELDVGRGNAGGADPAHVEKLRELNRLYPKDPNRIAAEYREWVKSAG